MMLECIPSRVNKRRLEIEIHHAANMLFIERAPGRLNRCDGLQRKPFNEALLKPRIVREIPDNHTDNAGGHQAIHQRDCLWVRDREKTPLHISCEHWDGHDSRKESKSCMVESRIPREENEREFVDLPFPAVDHIRED